MNEGTWPWEYTETVPRDEPVRRSPDPVRRSPDPVMDLRELTKALRSLQSQVEVLSDLINSHEKVLSRIGAYEVRDAE